MHEFNCPFCGHSANEMTMIGLDLPVLREKQVIGAGRRPVGCSACGSTDRERLIYAYLAHELKIFTGDRHFKILHFAPEKNLTRELLSANFQDYVCGDLFTMGIESYPAHVRNMNVLDIPFDADHFDLVICNHVLEHVPADIDAMKEIRRVLKPGGQAILQVPISKNSASTAEDLSITDPDERERLFGQSDHMRIYGQDYTDRLVQSGFNVKRINISARYKKYGLNKNEDLFINVK